MLITVNTIIYLMKIWHSKNHREQAKASNCYTRKESRYLPEWDVLVTPFFKKSYEDKQLYFELTDALTTDREFFSKYLYKLLCENFF